LLEKNMIHPTNLLGGFCLALALGGLTLASAQEKQEEKKADPHADLIGKPAPDFAIPDFALNGKPASLANLKGKVVLLDFWAVWCGPCIATFPHLREWNKEFKDKGLQIVGVTTYYENFGFDKDTGKLKRLTDGLGKVEEQDMLRDFVGHHKLGHLIQPLSMEEWKKLGEAYHVGGIPTAVLIDRQGVVRMVKAGAEEENAKALGEEIKKLLDEK
jgi:thiol-disulfide isomerase/thioredoxin